jgi:hypothetical protein
MKVRVPENEGRTLQNLVVSSRNRTNTDLITGKVVQEISGYSNFTESLRHAFWADALDH